MRIIPTALLAGVGSLALIGAAFAHTPTPTHHVSIRLPNGAVEEIEYSGNIAPHISFRQAPAIQTAYPSPFAMFGPNSPFAAMERISAEMNREAAQLMQQVNAIAAAPLPGPGRLMSADARNMPPGAKGYSFVATLSPNGVCTQSREIITAGPGKAPRMISRSSGSCSPSSRFQVLDAKPFTAAPARHAQIDTAKAEQAKPAPAKLQQVAWLPY